MHGRRNLCSFHRIAGEQPPPETALSRLRRASCLRLPSPEETDGFTTGETMECSHHRGQGLPGERSGFGRARRPTLDRRCNRYPSPPGTGRRITRGNRNRKTNVVAALLDYGAPPKRTHGPPRHRWTASTRSRRSLRRAPRLEPHILSDVPALRIRVSRSGSRRTSKIPSGGKTKTLRSVGSGGVRETDVSIPLEGLASVSRGRSSEWHKAIAPPIHAIE